MLTAYVTKPLPMDVICGGLDRCTVWLIHRPTFQPLLLECPIFGDIIDPNAIRSSHWNGEHAFSGKVLRKSSKDVADYVWSKVLETFHKQELCQLFEAHNNASEAFHQQHIYPMPKAHTDSHAFFALEDARQRFICERLEKDGMRQHEWILELPLNLTLARSL